MIEPMESKNYNKLSILCDAVNCNKRKGIEDEELNTEEVATSLQDSDDAWHEKQINSRLYIHDKMDEYIGALTVHGLTKVFTGTRLESLFWSVMLTLGTTLTLFVIKGLVVKYLEHHVYVQISSQMVDEKPFPSITFCDENKLFENYYAYCGMSCRNKKATESTDVCKEKFMHLNAANESMDSGRWSNGLFTVNACYTWGSKNCNSLKYLQSVHRYNDACFTFNYNGNLSDIYGHFLIDFSYNHTYANATGARETNIIALPHDPDIIELDFTLRNQMESTKTLTMVFDNIIIKRLPSPFPSDCTTSKTNDIFPGEYSRRSCIETTNYLEMYHKCGDVVDYVRQYIPQHVQDMYGRNKSIADTCNCIREFSKLESIKAYCPFPCKETEISVLSNFNRWSKAEQAHALVARKKENVSKYRLDFQYQRVDSYRLIEEEELYTLYQMACEVGGFVGLVIGASILSFIEIFTLIFLSLWKRFRYPDVK